MLNVNYGNNISEEMRLQLVKLLKCEMAIVDTGISEDIIMEMMNHSGEKVLNIATGKTIDEATRCLPNNQDELISEAAVLIKINSEYHFFVTELVNLIRYFDSYPMDPKITWRYSYDPNQEEPVYIIIFKTLKHKRTDETN